MPNKCPFFEEDRCVSERYSELELKVSSIDLCETEEHVNCPFYIGTVTMEKETKEWLT